MKDAIDQDGIGELYIGLEEKQKKKNFKNS